MALSSSSYNLQQQFLPITPYNWVAINPPPNIYSLLVVITLYIDADVDHAYIIFILYKLWSMMCGGMYLNNTE